MTIPRISPVIIVHGGAGSWPKKKHASALQGAEEAANKGHHVLLTGGTARQAVEAAIISLEDNPIFNAGTGSTVNLEGRIENDAAIMDGKMLETGAVAMIHGVKNPIRLARIVMEQTDHVLIAGRTGERLAQAFKLDHARPVTQERLAVWKWEKRTMEKGRPSYFRKNVQLQRSGVLATLMDTVGALAIDSMGTIAAGASTGGVTLKLPGRIGDSAIVGAGLYSDNRLGAATATGLGELAIRTSIAKTACDLMMSVNAQTASSRAVRISKQRVGNGLGLITLDRSGRIGVSHTTQHLCWASSGRRGTISAMKGTRV